MDSLGKSYSSFSKGMSNILPGGYERRQTRIGETNEIARIAKRAQIGWDNWDINQQKAWAQNPENELWTILTSKEQPEWKFKAGLGRDPNNRVATVVTMRNSTDRRGGKRARTKTKSRSKSKSKSKSRTRRRSRSRTGGRK